MTDAPVSRPPGWDLAGESRRRRRRLWLVGVVAAALVAVAALVVVRALTRPDAADRKYVGVADLCRAMYVGPLTQLDPRLEIKDYPATPNTPRCAMLIGPQGLRATIFLQATVRTSARDTRARYASDRSSASAARDVAGLGTGAYTDFYEGVQLEVVAYDANLHVRIYWQAGTAPRPADALDRLTRLVHSVLDVLRNPEA